MIGLFLSLAIIAAVVSLGVRRRQRRSSGSRPGATILRPVLVDRFDDIDTALRERLCWCGGTYAAVGETSRSVADRRFRIARLVCPVCEREEFVYFDVTMALQ